MFKHSRTFIIIDQWSMLFAPYFQNYTPFLDRVQTHSIVYIAHNLRSLQFQGLYYMVFECIRLNAHVLMHYRDCQLSKTCASFNNYYIPTTFKT